MKGLVDENKIEIQKYMTKNKELQKNEPRDYKISLKGIWSSKEIMNIRRSMMLRLNHILGVFYCNWRPQILNYKTLIVNFQSKVRIIRASTQYQGTSTFWRLIWISHDGNNPIPWLFQIEQYFDLHQLATLQKVNTTTMFLE